MRFDRGALATFAALFLSALPARGESIAGVIVDAEKGDPIPRVTVELVETSRQTSTDGRGGFHFDNVDPGRYTLSIHHLAYALVERVVRVAGDTVENIRVALRPAILPSEEIVVRSTRLSSPRERAVVPSALETADRLVSRPYVSVPDALADAPGLAVVRDGAWETGISIRGLGKSNVVALVDNTRIETATDLAGPLSLVNLHDLERVEAVKSPGSVLYGTGALGGVVSMVTRKASFAQRPLVGAEVSAGYSSVDDCLEQYAALDAATQRTALRLSAGQRKAGDTMTPAGLLPNSQFRDFSLLGSAGIKTIGDQSFLLSYQRSQTNDAGIPGGSPIPFSAQATYTLARRELVAAEYAIPNISPALALLTIRLSRQEIVRNVSIVQGPSITLTPHATHTTLGVQVESRLLPSARDLLIFGAEAWQRRLDSQRERRNAATGQIVGERPAPLSSYSSGGLYAQNEWTAIPGTLTLATGGRFDWIRIANDETWNPQFVTINGVLQAGPPNRQLLWEGGRVRNASLSGSAGIEYCFDPAWTLTFLASTAFRSPSLEERYQFIDLGSVVELGNPHLQPERSTCLNLGLLHVVGGMNCRADVFLNSLFNLVVQQPALYEGRNAYVNTNVGRASLSGFEISAEQRIAGWASLQGSIAYVRGEDTYAHVDLPQIAPMHGSAQLSACAPAFGTVRVTLLWAAAQRMVAAGEQQTPGYAVFDIGAESATWELDAFTVSVRAGVRNLFDRMYRDHLSTFRGIVRAEPGRGFYVSTTLTP